MGAAGGWLEGASLGNGSDRLYGYGVDEVLQLEMEMVLADGTHMKFGPQNGSKGGPGLLYPQTTRVEGKCNARAHNEDCEWAWQASPH